MIEIFGTKNRFVNIRNCFRKRWCVTPHSFKLSPILIRNPSRVVPARKLWIWRYKRRSWSIDRISRAPHSCLQCAVQSHTPKPIFSHTVVAGQLTLSMQTLADIADIVNIRILAPPKDPLSPGQRNFPLTNPFDSRQMNPHQKFPH